MARARTWDPDVPAPAWFTRSLAAPGEPIGTVVAGATVRALAWGERGAPTLVLVHGGAAHAHWWSPIAPLLADRYRVVVPDLTGHGDSDPRDSYAVTTWADEVLAAAAAGGGGGRPIVVGHSMGGFVTIATAALHGGDLEGAIIVDAPVTRPDPETTEGVSGAMFRAPKVYADLEEGMQHFHLVPPQPCANGWIVAHVARHSLVAVDGGVRWKFDPGVFTRRTGPNQPGDYGRLLARAACRMAVINGADSEVVSADTRTYMAQLLADSPAATAGVPFVEVPEAQHHLLLDQPLALVAALRAVLAAWDPVGRPAAAVVVPPTDGAA